MFQGTFNVINFLRKLQLNLWKDSSEKINWIDCVKAHIERMADLNVKISN